MDVPECPGNASVRVYGDRLGSFVASRGGVLDVYFHHSDPLGHSLADELVDLQGFRGHLTPFVLAYAHVARVVIHDMLPPSSEIAG